MSAAWTWRTGSPPVSGRTAMRSLMITPSSYLGAFSGPPLIGALAEPAGLSAALGVLVAATAAIALLASRALGRR
jgi:hypothetical protein